MKSIFFSADYPTIAEGYNSSLQFCANSTSVVWGVGDESNSFNFEDETETDEDRYIAGFFLTTPKKLKEWAKRIHANYTAETTKKMFYVLNEYEDRLEYEICDITEATHYSITKWSDIENDFVEHFYKIEDAD